MNKLVKSLSKFNRYYAKQSPIREVGYFFILTYKEKKQQNSEQAEKNVVVDFSPPQQKKYSFLDSQPTFPVYNKDKNFYTKAFIDSKEREYCLSKPKKLRDKFLEKQNKHLQFVSSKSQPEALIAKPENKYCQVCKGLYESYQEHIKEEYHQQQKQKSFGQAGIEYLVKYWNKRKNRKKSSSEDTPQPTLLPKRKAIKKEAQIKKVKRKKGSIEKKIK